MPERPGRGYSLSRAFDVLEFIYARHTPFTKTHLAVALNLHPRSALRYIGMAETRGWVRRSVKAGGQPHRFTSRVRLVEVDG